VFSRALLISREIEIYQQLLFKALNLGDKQKREPTVIEKALNLDGKQKREMSNDLLDRSLLKPPEKDELDHSFS